LSTESQLDVAETSAHDVPVPTSGEAGLATERTYGPLPFVIGVTGHRDLRPDDCRFLEGIVRATFMDIQEAHPHCPLVLLSPLAEGGDRLVARIALDMRIRLIVPLPLPLDLYEQDFETEESRTEFRSLLERAEARIAIPLIGDSVETRIRTPGADRNRQYAAVGAYIARHSQVFLALWDGVRPDDGTKAGGTAQIVQFRLEGAPAPFDPPRSPLTFANTGPVYHIITPRTQEPVIRGEAFTRRDLFPANKTPESFRGIYKRMDIFNEDALACVAGSAAAVEESRKQVFQASADGWTHLAESLPARARRILDQYAIVDALAVQFGRKTLSASGSLFTWVFVAALGFNVFHSFPHVDFGFQGAVADRLVGMPWFLVLFLGLFLFCSRVLHRRATKGDYQNKHQDYRAIAEALRIQFFWSVAGVTGSVVDRYLRKQKGELEWIRCALRSWDVVADATSDGASQGEHEPAQHLHFVRKHWVAAQRTYFASKARREQAALEKDERMVARLVNASLALTTAFAAVLILPMLLPLHVLEELKHIVELPAIHGTVMLVIVMLLVLAGLRHGYSQKLARSEHAKQFSRMSELFDIAENRLEVLLREHQHEEARALLRELGAEALEENGDWVLLHRERPLEVPHAG
jgi:hypothetical protein